MRQATYGGYNTTPTHLQPHNRKSITKALIGLVSNTKYRLTLKRKQLSNFCRLFCGFEHTPHPLLVRSYVLTFCGLLKLSKLNITPKLNTSLYCGIYTVDTLKYGCDSYYDTNLHHFNKFYTKPNYYHVSKQNELSLRKFQTLVSFSFLKNYSIVFLVKNTNTRIYKTIWSCRITCFYKLVSPTYSKTHSKKYKKFIDILTYRVYLELSKRGIIANYSLSTPNPFNLIGKSTKKTASKTESNSNQNSEQYFKSLGLMHIRGNFFRTLKIKRGLPRRIRRKVLSKKVGRFWQ